MGLENFSPLELANPAPLSLQYGMDGPDAWWSTPLTLTVVSRLPLVSAQEGEYDRSPIIPPPQKKRNKNRTWSICFNNVLNNNCKHAFQKSKNTAIFFQKKV